MSKYDQDMAESFYELYQKSSVSKLFLAITMHAIENAKNGPVEKWEGMNSAMLADLVGMPRDEKYMPEPSAFGEFAFRVGEVNKAILELERIGTVFQALPIAKLKSTPSEQLRMFHWYYLNLVFMFQERVCNLRTSSSPFAKNEEAKTQLLLEKNSEFTKRRFIKKYLSPLRPSIERRNVWVHNQPIPDKENDRLSLLETFSIFPKLDAAASPKLDIFKSEHRKLMKKLKSEFVIGVSANAETLVTLADSITAAMLDLINLPNDLAIK